MSVKKYSGKAHPWQQTFSGREIIFHDILENDDTSQIDITDIAHALARQCRYSGHVRFHYSVGQHSLIASYVMPALGGDPLEGLLHDSHEAYITDLPTPIKRVLGDVWYEFENKMQRKVYDAIAPQLELPMSTVMKMVDYGMLAWESDGFVLERINDWGVPKEIQDLSTRIQDTASLLGLDRQMNSEEVTSLFLKRYEELT